MVKCIILLLAGSLCQYIVKADDIYLKSGFVYRYVRVMDTTDNTVRVVGPKNTFSLPLEVISKIEKREIPTGSIVVYELYSEEMNKEFQIRRQEISERAEEIRVIRSERNLILAEDSLGSLERSRNTFQPWRNSLFIAGGWGTPQGGRFELGYNFGSELALGFVVGFGDTWSKQAKDGTVGIFALLRFPMGSSPVTPHLFLCTGQDLSLGAGDTYSLIYIGTTVSLRPWLQGRPELGFVMTSRHISGGKSLFGGYTPEVKDNKTRLGVNLTVEIDFRQVFFPGTR